ncbi:hypothetical protein Tco_1027380 [Tanacetum coccineum]
MEVFSLMLQRQIEKDSSFSYHFGCKSIKLVHVSFADDLLVMWHGDSNYVKVIKRALDEFNACSGLLPNNSKSTMFFSSLNKDEKNAILSVLPFATGKLPVSIAEIHDNNLGLMDSIQVLLDAGVVLIQKEFIKRIMILLVI